MTAASDVAVGRFALVTPGKQFKGLDMRIEESLTGGYLERTMEGASTLSVTVHDPNRTLLRSGILAAAVDVVVDGRIFRLAQAQKQSDDLTMVFEDKAVALLRTKTAPRKASRARMTRAEFAKSLVDEVRVPFVCPELHRRQKVEISTDAEKKSDRSREENRDKGIGRGAKLVIRYGDGSTRPANVSQIGYLERVLDVADSLNAPQKAKVALVEACMIESGAANLNRGDATSLGILQVLASTAEALGIKARDVEACANVFLTRGFTGRGGAILLARQNPSWSAGQVAQACQGSAHPGRYDMARGEAEAVVAAYEGQADDQVTVVTRLPFQFRRGGVDGQVENSWDALKRLADEVNWRCFVSDGAVYFVSETTLIRSKPQLRLTEETPGIFSIDFDVDSGKVRDTATVACHAERWFPGPGTCVALDECGPANGRWLVESVRRELYSTEATVRLHRRTAPLPEPAAETRTRTYAIGDPSTGNRIDDAYAAAQRINDKRFPYVWGGGHAACGRPDRGTGRDPGIGYDCSGSTCAVLAHAGLGFQLGKPATNSTGLASWGVPGQGRYMTIWANAVHVFIVFERGVGGPSAQHFGTGDWGKGWGGAGFNPNLHPTAGFTPRHWPGL